MADRGRAAPAAQDPVASDAPWRLSGVDAVALIRGGRLSAVELVTSLVQRISALDGDLRAWVTVDPDGALHAAQSVDRRLAAGEETGPLAGLPFGIKDVIHVGGLPTTASSRVLADFVPADDAACIQALRQADATILGKVHTAEFAGAEPAPTRNPWNREHTPGGSSSGSAAAVAAGTVPIALGTQTGGSILRPAAYNGVVGLKPTYGTVSNDGVIPLAWSLDHVGVISRSVADAALALSVLGWTDVSADVDADPQRPPVIGLIGSGFLDTCEQETCEHTMQVVERLEANGANVREIRLPSSFGRIGSGAMMIMSSEVHAYHRYQHRRKRALYGPMISEMIDAGARVTTHEYLRALRERRDVTAAVEAALEGVDIALTPATPAPAPRDTTTTGDARFQMPWSYAGLPAIALPSGLTRSGLPLGIQLVGHRWRDGDLLRAARWCEARIDFDAHPPCWTDKESL